MNASFWAGVGIGAVVVPVAVILASVCGALFWLLWKRVPRGRVF